MNMIEKVARAIHTGAVDLGARVPTDLNDVPEASREHLFKIVRIAITAMRELTIEMTYDRKMVDVAIYIDIIDAALKE